MVYSASRSPSASISSSVSLSISPLASISPSASASSSPSLSRSTTLPLPPKPNQRKFFIVAAILIFGLPLLGFLVGTFVF